MKLVDGLCHAVAFGVGGVVEGAGVAVVEEVMGGVLLSFVHTDCQRFDGFGVAEVGDGAGGVFCDFCGELGFWEAGGAPDKLDEFFTFSADGGGQVDGDGAVDD